MRSMYFIITVDTVAPYIGDAGERDSRVIWAGVQRKLRLICSNKEG